MLQNAVKLAATLIHSLALKSHVQLIHVDSLPLKVALGGVCTRLGKLYSISKALKNIIVFFMYHRSVVEALYFDNRQSSPLAQLRNV